MTNTAPNTSAADDPGLWVSITELARRKGVKPPTISVRVTRFEAEGRLKTRPGRGKVKLVNLAEYDHVAGEVTDLFKEQAAATVRDTRRDQADPPPAAATDPTFTDARRRQAQYDADIRALDYAARTRAVLSSAEVTEAMVQASEKIVRTVSTLSGRAADVAAAARMDGELGVRRALKAAERDLLKSIGAAMRLIEAHGRTKEAAGKCFIDDADLKELPAP